MVKCPRCGHMNLPSFPTCSRCGTPFAGAVGPGSQLPPGSRGIPQAPDELTSLMDSRARAQKKNRTLFGGIFLVAAIGVAYFWWTGRKSTAVVQEKLNFFERWAEMDKRETGAFFNCVMASQIDMDLFNTSDQVQQRVESAYFTQQKTFSEYLSTDCVPKIERARSAIATLKDPPAELAPPLAKYQDVLPQLQSGVEEYAEKIKGRQGVKDVDQLIQEMGMAWHQGGKPSKTWKVSQKFFEEDARQLQAWESCGKRSRKGKKVDDLATFLKAVADYKDARAGMAKAAHQIQGTKKK